MNVRVTEVKYEVQRKSSVFSTSFRPSEWARIDGNKLTVQEQQDVLPNGWKWLGEWRHEGANSWEYGSRWHGSFSSSETVFDTIKRRRWTRHRVKTNVSAEELQELKRQGKQFKIMSTDQVNTGMAKFHSELHDVLQRASHTTKKPTVLLLGGSGAGKSSLVNAVFGKPLAEIGEGKPITQNYTRYSGADSPVIIYDSRGIEHGYVEHGFVADTRRFFSKLRQEKDLGSHVHVVWYVIDLTQARFQPFEAEFCRKELEGIPIIFVFNKVDSVTPEVRDVMMDTVRNFKLPNCLALFATVADCKNFDRRDCPKCGSTRIRKRLREGTCTIMCKECKEQTLMTKTSGIEELASTTLSCLPDLIQDTFLSNEKATLHELQQGAKDIILNMAEGVKISKSEVVSQHLADMTSRLAKHYGLDMVADIVRDAIVRKFRFYFRERHRYKKALTMLGDMFRKTNQAEALLVLSGLEICVALIEVRRALSALAVEEYEKNREKKQDGNDSSGEGDAVADSSSGQNGNSDSSKQQAANSQDDLDWKIEKIITNMHFDVDSHLVHDMSLKLKQFGDVGQYLQHVKIDGTRSYRTVEPVIEAGEWQVVEEEDVDDYIPIHNYQRQQVEKMRADEAAAAASAKANVSPTEAPAPAPAPAPAAENS